MLQIKTIADSLDNVWNFDDEVNAAIAEGWKLTKRTMMMPQAHATGTYTHPVLYAELERDVITEAERGCENCKHCDLDGSAVPCRECKDGPDNYPTHWEAADA